MGQITTLPPLKRYLLLIAIIVSSCSGDGIGPDWAERIEGTWKTEILTVGTYRTQGTWEIEKTGDKTVLIKVSRTIWPDLNNNDRSDTYPEAAMNTAWMSDKNTLVVETNLAAVGADFCGIKGEGKLSGDMLHMVVHTECKGEIRILLLKTSSANKQSIVCHYHLLPIS
ncbi:hypothetical protein [Dyadobacter arcticus]|uniref:Lipocalin-like domain-containing protein n=1 Tax=Dyadobacter arcticus TaxID=1078754 RepID=A0ABX0UJU8_9BACT|nr:hypothetical protein [Dyadobacter arcticus]NIJ52299.1 hypothetical protein [Dyadobacter arcticus]